MPFDRRFWGAAGVTAVIMALYGAVILGLAPKPDPDIGETLKALALLAAGYWLGSSSGSAAKDTKGEP